MQPATKELLAARLELIPTAPVINFTAKLPVFAYIAPVYATIPRNTYTPMTHTQDKQHQWAFGA